MCVVAQARVVDRVSLSDATRSVEVRHADARDLSPCSHSLHQAADGSNGDTVDFVSTDGSGVQARLPLRLVTSLGASVR